MSVFSYFILVSTSKKIEVFTLMDDRNSDVIDH